MTDTSLEASKTEKQKKKKERKKEKTKQKTQGLWENWKSSKIHIIGISEREEIFETTIKSTTLGYLFQTTEKQRINSKRETKIKDTEPTELLTNDIPFLLRKCKQEENCMKYLKCSEKKLTNLELYTMHNYPSKVREK